MNTFVEQNKQKILFRKIKAMIIPKIGCILPTILAVLTEKYFKLLIKREWPIAVVTRANKIIYGYCVIMLLVSFITRKGNKITLKNKVWYIISDVPL